MSLSVLKMGFATCVNVVADVFVFSCEGDFKLNVEYILTLNREWMDRYYIV